MARPSPPQRGIERASHLVQELLTLARGARGRPRAAPCGAQSNRPCSHADHAALAVENAIDLEAGPGRPRLAHGRC